MDLKIMMAEVLPRKFLKEKEQWKYGNVSNQNHVMLAGYKRK